MASDKQNANYVALRGNTAHAYTDAQRQHSPMLHQIGRWGCCKTLVAIRAYRAMVLGAVVMAWVAQVNGLAAEPRWRPPMRFWAGVSYGSCSTPTRATPSHHSTAYTDCGCNQLPPLDNEATAIQS